MKRTKEKRKIEDILEDYKYNDDIFNEENDLINYIKRALNELPQSNKYIMLLYADDASLKKTSERLNISKTPLYNELKRLRKIIIKKIENYKEYDNRRIGNLDND